MDSIVLIIIASLFFILYMIYQYRKGGENKQKVSLLQVEAGSTKKWFKRKTDLMSPVGVDIADIKMDQSLMYFVVKNKCMTPKGISDGDIIGVKPFNETFTINDTSEGDVLLIYLDDDRFKGYKIREKGSPEDNGRVYATYHYKNGIRNKSSKSHSVDAIKGVVSEVYGKTYIGSFKN